MASLDLPLNELQREASDAVLENHNLVLTGQAGTGKSFVIRDVVPMLQFDERPYALLCTTGIACLQFFEFGATTVHR